MWFAEKETGAKESDQSNETFDQCNATAKNPQLNGVVHFILVLRFFFTGFRQILVFPFIETQTFYTHKKKKHTQNNRIYSTACEDFSVIEPLKRFEKDIFHGIYKFE